MKLISIFVISLLLCCEVFCDNDPEARKLSSKLNPGCDLSNSRCDNLTVAYVTAESDFDTLHYIWDFTGVPSLFVARTSKNTTLFINWEGFMEGKAKTVNFSSEPTYVFSAVIRKIFIFDDPKDKADVDDASSEGVRFINPHNFNWSRNNFTQFEDRVMLQMNASVGTNGSFTLQLMAFGSTKHGDELPHLYHSSHSMQFDLIAERLDYYNYTKPRVAVEFLIVASENKSEGSFYINKRRNLDDEFTPGIFDVYDIVSPRSNNDTRGSFFQYRPICYITKDRTVSGSTELKPGQIRSLNEDIDQFQYTLPYSYYGYSLGTRIAQGMNITFGMTGDGFYSRTQYVSFSMLMGIGHPPVERLSTFVVTFAVIGLGIPLLVLLVGGVYVGIKRYRSY